MFAAFLVAWQMAVVVFAIPPFLLPSPIAILSEILSPSIPWISNTIATTYEALIGFALAIIFGIGFAVLMALSEKLKRISYPFIITAQVVPKLAFIPILFIWLGFSDLPRIITVFLVCFFPIIIDSFTGLVLIEPDMIDLVRSYTSSKMDLLLKAMIPSALPNIFAGLKVSITLAVIGALVAEFVSSNKGLGFLIISAQVQLDTTLAFAAATLLVFVGLILYVALEVLERFLVPWRTEGISSRLA